MCHRICSWIGQQADQGNVFRFPAGLPQEGHDPVLNVVFELLDQGCTLCFDPLPEELQGLGISGF